MKADAARAPRGLWLGELVFYVLPVPVALLALSLISMQMKYHDVGINMGANNGFLAIFVAPVLLVGLYAAAIVSRLLARRWLASAWAALLTGALVTVLLGLGAFLVEWQLYADRSSEAGDMGTFLAYYTDTMLGRWRAR